VHDVNDDINVFNSNSGTVGGFSRTICTACYLKSAMMIVIYLVHGQMSVSCATAVSNDDDDGNIGTVLVVV
jgi:hypothetical protein